MSTRNHTLLGALFGAIVIFSAAAHASDCGLATAIDAHADAPHVLHVPSFPGHEGSVAVSSHGQRSHRQPVDVIGIDYEGRCHSRRELDLYPFHSVGIAPPEGSEFRMRGSQWFIVSVDRNLAAVARGKIGESWMQVDAHRYHVPGGIPAPRVSSVFCAIGITATVEKEVAGLTLEVLDTASALPGAAPPAAQWSARGRVNTATHFDLAVNGGLDVVAVRWAHHDGRKGPKAILDCRS